jgi:hypothetical protein
MNRVSDENNCLISFSSKSNLTFNLSITIFLISSELFNRDIKSIEEFTMDDIELVDYKCHTAIKADMAV